MSIYRPALNADLTFESSSGNHAAMVSPEFLTRSGTSEQVPDSGSPPVWTQNPSNYDPDNAFTMNQRFYRVTDHHPLSEAHTGCGTESKFSFSLDESSFQPPSGISTLSLPQFPGAPVFHLVESHPKICLLPTKELTSGSESTDFDRLRSCEDIELLQLSISKMASIVMASARC